MWGSMGISSGGIISGPGNDCGGYQQEIFCDAGACLPISDDAPLKKSWVSTQNSCSLYQLVFPFGLIFVTNFYCVMLFVYHQNRAVKGNFGCQRKQNIMLLQGLSGRGFQYCCVNITPRNYFVGGVLKSVWQDPDRWAGIFPTIFCFKQVCFRVCQKQYCRRCYLPYPWDWLLTEKNTWQKMTRRSLEKKQRRKN